MSSGIHSTISYLNTRLRNRWCPKWYGAFVDPAGGFYERLGKGFKPILTGQRRLVTQCRQLSIYSHAKYEKVKGFKPDLRAHFDHIVNRYYNPKLGIWYFSVDDEGIIKERECDLYALAFVIFAFSHYFRATGDERAQVLARQVMLLISSKFELPLHPGYAEAIDEKFAPIPRIRRQNPHMHLLEACLFAHETWKEAVYERTADSMVLLFRNYFYDEDKKVLREFFENDLSPHHQRGGQLEPGHHYEWIWLLKKHAAMKGDAAIHDKTCLELLEWANEKGWDTYFGGIYDTVWDDGEVTENTKRIWPFCEALKANALMLTLAPDRQAIKNRVSEMVNVFKEKYIQERGFWTEWLNRDLTPAADYMPGTTPYHVYFGIVETMQVLDRRGSRKSIMAGVWDVLYFLRRAASRTISGILKG